MGGRVATGNRINGQTPKGQYSTTFIHMQKRSRIAMTPGFFHKEEMKRKGRWKFNEKELKRLK